MVGIGYRKDFAEVFADNNILKPSFIEVAPENWMNVGGYYKKLFDKALEKHPLFVHGLSLSVGSPEGIDIDFVKQVKQFLDDTNTVEYSEHLSFSKCDNAHLFDLLPIPFTQDAVKHVAKNIRLAQDILERKIAIEIVSYYSPIAAEMTELEFINNVIKEADCNLLLDVNNIYVNSFNHQYNAKEFLANLDLDRVKYIHMAGHTQVSEDLINRQPSFLRRELRAKFRIRVPSRRLQSRRQSPRLLLRLPRASRRRAKRRLRLLS